MREAGLRRILDGRALHGYVYIRWIKEYLNVLIRLGLPRAGPSAKKWVTNHYHGKVLTPELAKAIITLNHDIPLQATEQIIPYPSARNLVLKGPPDVAVFQCGCRHFRYMFRLSYCNFVPGFLHNLLKVRKSSGRLRR
jgi:hypothetical protein